MSLKNANAIVKNTQKIFDQGVVQVFRRFRNNIMKILKEMLFWCLFWSVWLGWYTLATLSMTEYTSNSPMIISIFLRGLCISTVVSTAISIYTSRLLEPNRRANMSFLLWALFGIFVAFPTFMVPSFFCESSQFGRCESGLFALFLLSPVILSYIFIGMVVGRKINRYVLSESG